MYFIKGNNESLSIGAGEWVLKLIRQQFEHKIMIIQLNFSGKFGIWLDGDLNQGRTEACNTYGNEPLVNEQDFVVKILECWAFL